MLREAVYLQGEGVLFLFTDTQIVDEKMLVYVNDLLASGEIPDLFAQEDKDEIINALRSETKSMGLADSAENCYMVFLQKVKIMLSAKPSMPHWSEQHSQDQGRVPHWIYCAASHEIRLCTPEQMGPCPDRDPQFQASACFATLILLNFDVPMCEETHIAVLATLAVS